MIFSRNVSEALAAVFKGRGGRSRQISGGHGEGETPLPIPNRAVKPLSADGTWPARARESRTPPVFASAPLPPSRPSDTPRRRRRRPPRRLIPAPDRASRDLGAQRRPRFASGGRRLRLSAHRHAWRGASRWLG